MLPIAICNELFESWDLAEICRFCKSLGYEGLELAPFTLGERPDCLPAVRRNEIRRIIEDSGLEVVGLHWLLARTNGLHLTSSDSATRQKTVDYLSGLVGLCADLGGRLLVFGSPQQRSFSGESTYAEAELAAIDAFQKLVPTLEGAGVTLALEPLGPQETNFINTAEAGVRIIRAINSPFVRLHLDVKAMSTEKTPIAQIIGDYHPWLAHFHANDPNRLGPGMGSVDYRDFWPTLRKNYHSWLSVEVFDFSPGPERIARESIEYLKRLMAIPD